MAGAGQLLGRGWRILVALMAAGTLGCPPSSTPETPAPSRPAPVAPSEPPAAPPPVTDDCRRIQEANAPALATFAAGVNQFPRGYWVNTGFQALSRLARMRGGGLPSLRQEFALPLRSFDAVAYKAALLDPSGRIGRDVLTLLVAADPSAGPLAEEGVDAVLAVWPPADLALVIIDQSVQALDAVPDKVFAGEPKEHLLRIKDTYDAGFAALRNEQVGGEPKGCDEDVVFETSTGSLCGNFTGLSDGTLAESLKPFGWAATPNTHTSWVTVLDAEGDRRSNGKADASCVGQGLGLCLAKLGVLDPLSKDEATACAQWVALGEALGSKPWGEDGVGATVSEMSRYARGKGVTVSTAWNGLFETSCQEAAAALTRGCNVLVSMKRVRAHLANRGYVRRS